MQSLPVIHVTAEDNYSAGKVIGSTFKDFIDDYIKTSKDVELFRKFYKSTKGRLIYDEYVRNSEKHFPEVVAEIRGIADGAGQDFVDIFLLQLASEIRYVHQFELSELQMQPPTEDKGCTDILINRKDLRVMAHNDDWSYEVSDRVYFGHVTITNKTGNDVLVKEQFMAYMYPGCLAGFCFGMNKDLVFTSNSVRPVEVNRKGIPLVILLRKLLSCKTIDECAATMENKPPGSSYGMNINIAHVNDDLMCSLEIYPEGSHTRVNIHKVVDGHYCKTNYYKHMGNAREKPLDGTYRRIRQAEEMVSHALTCVDDVINVLGDTSDELEPIYREPSEKYLTPNSKTSATAVFDLKKRRLDVYRANPKLVKPCYSTDFI